MGAVANAKGKGTWDHPEHFVYPAGCIRYSEYWGMAKKSRPDEVHCQIKQLYAELKQLSSENESITEAVFPNVSIFYHLSHEMPHSHVFEHSGFVSGRRQPPTKPRRARSA